MHLPKGHQINLGGHEMIRLLSNLCFFCEILDKFTSLGLRQLLKLNHVRSLGGESVFGGTANNSDI